MVKFDTKIINIIHSKPKKKIRMKIKNSIQLLKTDLFQVPFPEIKWKKVSNYKCNDCFFYVLTALRLRHYIVSKEDSRKIYKRNKSGVEVNNAAKYVSTIFGTPIVTSIDENINLKIKNGYATFVCGAYSPKNNLDQNGHFFIVYKHNNVIYYYDPQSRINSSDLNVFSEKMLKHKSKDKFDCFVSYHNVYRKNAMLIKSKMITRFHY